MNRNKTVMATATAVVAAAVLAACGGGTGEQRATSAATAAPASSTTAAAPHNQADMMFARHMIPHHQQAVQMSDVILAKPGIDPRVTELATAIKAAQAPEIQQMQGWLDQWGMPAGMPSDHANMPGMGDMPGMEGMPGMDGMMSPADMQALNNAQGVAAAKLFLTQMIQHHQGAITMAQNEIKNGQFPDAITLSKSIVTSQQKEIDTMNQILPTL